MKHPALVILKALLEGRRVEMNGHTYTKVDTDDGFRLAIVGHVIDEDKEVFLGCEMSLNVFVEMCAKLPEEEVVGVVAQLAMT